MPDRRGMREFGFPAHCYLFVEKSVSSPSGGSAAVFSQSEWPAMFLSGFVQSPAAVKVRLAPDPRLVGAAHLGFYLMDPAEVALFCHAAQERADRDILTRVRVAHFDRDNIPEVVSPESGTGYLVPILHERDKPAQDIGPFLLHPDVNICYSRGNSRPEDPTAESALLTRFIIHYQFIH